ncbi:TPA: ORF6N domain-containing protein [Yersinia enterocolitica]|uniref:ORF6N domain-containing protein n=1 Tax=Yersinia enterocolitica TaxID=630 RepID=UPI00030D0DFE|nr:ORF6N domain-containing protein [Yersinia enterocolitica]
MKTVCVETLPHISHLNIPVITTELLAKLYSTGVKNIQMNYARNKERFVVGKHLFKLQGPELKELKHRPTISRSVKIVSNVCSLILWTKRGAARHAKMLETEQAWDVFEKLEDCYFNRMEQPPNGTTYQSTPAQLKPLHQTAKRLITTGLGKIYSDIWKLVHARFDVEHIHQLHPQQIDEAVSYLTTLEGEYLGRQEVLTRPTFSADFPLSWWDQFEHQFKSFGSHQYSLTDPGKFPIKMLFGDTAVAPTAIGKLIVNLTKAGYDVSAARFELSAHRHYAELMYSNFEKIHRIAESILSNATGFRFSPH